MDLFEHRYYKLNKKLMTLLGQWPYQSARVRRGIIIAVIFFINFTGLVPVLLALVRYSDDWGIVLDCGNACLFAAVGIMKFIVIIWNAQKTLKLLNDISTNWQVWARSRELNMLHEYAEQGEKMTIVYTTAIYATTFLFVTQPMIPKIIDFVLKNGTELGKFPYPVDYYYFDTQKYYYYIMMHFYMCAGVAAMPLVASDTMLIICVQHVCSVFAALGHQLGEIGDNYTLVETVARLRSLVDRHNDAIEYAYLIEAMYTWNLFIVLGIGTILVNVLGIQILTRTNDPESTIRLIAFVLSLVLVFFMDCYFSQCLIDHSNNIGFYIYNSQWYRLLPTDQKLLQLMTMRSRTNCQLTAGTVLIMSMRTFGLTSRTVMSYFAVIRPK